MLYAADDHLVSEVGSLSESVEDRPVVANARRLDAKHLVAKVQPKLRSFAEAVVRCGLARDGLDQGWPSDQFFGDPRTGLEQLDGVFRKPRIGVQASKLGRVGHDLLEERLESCRTPVERSRRHYGSELRRPLIEEPDEVA